jgi:hypothetical protein
MRLCSIVWRTCHVRGFELLVRTPSHSFCMPLEQAKKEAVSSDLVFVVSGSSGLLDALEQRGINATETQLLFSSGAPGAHSCFLLPRISNQCHNCANLGCHEADVTSQELLPSAVAARV